MLRLSRWVAVVAILLSTSVAFAQRPAGGQPGGGRPGGFGGGGFGGFGGGGPLTLVNMESVQKELGLKEDQISKLKTLGEEVREARGTGGAGGGREAFQALQDLPKEERDKKVAEMVAKAAEERKKIDDKFKPKLAEILDASQRERLQQIAWQNLRSQVYTDAGLVAALKVTKEQQEKLAAVSKDFGEKQRELFGQGGDDARAKGRELSESRDKALSEVLTADQREQFTKLMGKKFDLPQQGGGFGGPGGGRPGQGAGGANPGGRPQRKAQDGDKKDSDKKKDSN